MAIVGNEPAASTDPAERRIERLHQEAIAQGREAEFLKSRPKYAAKIQGGGSAAGGGHPGYGGKSTRRGLRGVDSKLPGFIRGSRDSAKGTNYDATLGQNVGSISGPTGSSSGEYGDDGRYHITTKLSEGQDSILSGMEGASGAALTAASGNLSGYSPLDWSGSPDERARIEEEVYGRLTRNMDRDRDREFEAMEQRMHNRGIPLDPSNPAYQRELQALNEKYDAAKANARGQAVEMGGGEMSRSFGIAHTTHGQKMTDTGQLYGMGSAGYMGTPELGFQPSDYIQPDTAAVGTAWRGQNIADPNRKRSGGGGGGSSQPAAPTRPPIVGG
jgi:hypothetical protein